MTFTTTDLITKSYYLSQVVAKGIETVSGDQLSDGLYLLNAILSMATARQTHIPYFTQYNFNTVVNQESYTVDDLISIETITFVLNSVRFSMEQLGRDDYFGTSRANNISTLPYLFHVERKLGGAEVYLYPLPNQIYPMTIWGNFALSNVTLGQELTTTLDKFYIEYLRYALAQMICAENSQTFQDENMRILKVYEKAISNVSPPDYTMKIRSSFKPFNGISYPVVNLSRGWTS